MQKLYPDETIFFKIIYFFNHFKYTNEMKQISMILILIPFYCIFKKMNYLNLIISLESYFHVCLMLLYISKY